MKYKIWHQPKNATNSRWIVIRPDLVIVGYYSTFEQARRAYIGDAITQRLRRRFGLGSAA